MSRGVEVGPQQLFEVDMDSVSVAENGIPYGTFFGKLLDRPAGPLVHWYRGSRAHSVESSRWKMGIKRRLISGFRVWAFAELVWES